jgi:hypothetical protein
MKPYALLCPFIIVTSLAYAATPAAAPAANQLPPPEATEVWTPVPAVITAAAGQPPSDAIVLFDGTHLSAWEPVRANGGSWLIEDGAMVVKPGTGDQRSKAAFGDVQLHVEFRTPKVIEGEGQGRGNSGIFLMGLYELQVLDSHNNTTYPNGQLGSVYKQHIPLANPARPPGEWQSYEIIFIAPRFDAAGKLVSPARVTAFINGVLVQNNVEVQGPTVYRGAPKYAAHADKLPITLQDHRNPTAFRNIWARPLDARAAAK